MSGRPAVTRIADGVYRVETDGRAEIVHVAGGAGDVWAHWNGHVVHEQTIAAGSARRRTVSDVHQSLSAPMPGTVLKVLVEPGTQVRKGDVLIVLEAMKMELPIRTAADGVVRAVSCREGELVQPGTVLVELE